jgi:hypothetical protein
MSSSGSRDPLELMDEATSGIAELGFSTWVRNAGIGTIVLSTVVAISEGIQSIGLSFFGPFQAIASGLADAISGTFTAAVDVVGAGGEATANSFLTGAAAALGPAAFPVAVGSIVVGIYIMSRGFQRFSPLDWVSGLWSDES